MYTDIGDLLKKSLHKTNPENSDSNLLVIFMKVLLHILFHSTDRDLKHHPVHHNLWF